MVRHSVIAFERWLPVPAWAVKFVDSHQVFQFAGYLLEDARFAWREQTSAVPVLAQK
jgi:hypothetical protein